MKFLKSVFVLVLFFTIIHVNVKGQSGYNPLLVNEVLEENILTPPNLAKIELEDSLNPFRYRVGVAMAYEENLAKKELLQVGDHYLLREVISIPTAKAIGVYFERFDLEEGQTLNIYNAKMELVQGPYNQNHNEDGGSFALPYVVGEKIILEFSSQIKSSFDINIKELAYFYRGVPDASKGARDFGDADACQVNVNCSEGNGWENQRDATVKISVKDGGGFYWCTGTIMNNSNGGCKPYILSADHCAENSTSSDFGQFVFYFNYQGVDCNNPVSELAVNFKTLTGCSRLAQSNSGGNTDSDFLLVELNDTIPKNFDVYYSGYDATSTIPNVGGVGIHHPDGDIKKISTFNGNVTTDSWGGVKQNSHFIVNWISTANGFGVTEGGSSGSAIFNSEGLVIGTLTGGASICNNPSSATDYYGRMYMHWDRIGTSVDKRLDLWLDPAATDSTNNLRLSGTRRPCLALPASVETKFVEKDIFKIYPNPANQQINFEVINSNISVKIFNSFGQLVTEKNQVSRGTFTFNLKPSTYIAEAYSEKGIQREKFIILQ